MPLKPCGVILVLAFGAGVSASLANPSVKLLALPETQVARLATPESASPSEHAGFAAIKEAFAVAESNAGKYTQDPKIIESLSFAAYVWGLAPEFVYRWIRYHEQVLSPVNTLTYGGVPAAWNNAGNSNAGNSSVLYVNGLLDLTRKDLVFTVPPAGDGDYIVAQIFDLFINTLSAPGTRTTPTSEPTHYLLAGPNSRYAHASEVRIKGMTFPVIPFDTNLGNLTVRIRTNPLAPAEDASSAPSVYARVVQAFALNTLKQFLENGGPVYPDSYDTPPPTQAQIEAAAPYQSAPVHAVGFFRQVGEALAANPLPSRQSGLSGTPVDNLPPWIVPQAGARRTYLVPSAGQWGTLALFRPIGLSRTGFQIPEGWTDPQKRALERGFQAAVAAMNQLVAEFSATAATNFWQYLNKNMGTYRNNVRGYLYRALSVLGGGYANLPEDAVYAQTNFLDGSESLDGNNIYSLTFLPDTGDETIPANGIIPPLVKGDDGNPLGFWSIIVYQPDTSQSSSPFISQVTNLNTHYTNPDTQPNPTEVVSCNSDNTITVPPPVWGSLKASTPILFGDHAETCGLTTGLPYYITDTPAKKLGTYRVSLSTYWQQGLSENGVPIPNTGTSGPVVSVTPSKKNLPNYAVIQPVSQLGSEQVKANSLVPNPDGSYTVWLAPPAMTDGLWGPPKLSDGSAAIPPANWIPTPSTAYLASIYGDSTALSTRIRPMIRMYYPTPGDQPPSILPCPEGSSDLCPVSEPATYVLPLLEKQ